MNRLINPTAVAFALLSSLATVSAQPGPVTTVKNNPLVLAASTLLTNGIPGLSGPPVNLMVASVQTNSAQGGTVSLATGQQWARRYNGTASNEDQAWAIKSDDNGNVIVGGYSSGAGTGLDYTTIKYTADGIALWTNRFDGPEHGTDQLRAIAVDHSGGVYVSGESAGAIVTIKYAPDGTSIWTNRYTGSGSFLFFGGIAVDGDGNAYILPSDDSNYYITVKYDINGNAAWTNFFRSTATSSESASDIAVDAAGNVFVTGSSFDNGADTCLTIKCASNGSIVWTNRYSLVGLESGSRMVLDQQGNIAVVGSSQGGTAQHKYFVVKYSSSGTALWTNIVAAVNYVGGGVPDITSDPAGNVFLVGGTPGATTADFTSVKFSSTGTPVWTNRFVDPSSGTQQMTGVGTDNAGNLYYSIPSASPNGTNYNYVTIKIGTNGAGVWTNRYNGPANASDLSRAMTVDKAGGVYATGTSSIGGSSFSALDYATVKYADNLRYVPPANFVGQDTITFTAFDSLGNSATSTVVVVVAPGPNIAVAPVGYTSAPGNTGVNTLVRSVGMPRTFQMQFTPAALGQLPVGAKITELRLRLSTNNATSFPSNTVTWSDYEITLAQAANPIASMSSTFAANMLNPVLVKDGTLSVVANNFTAGNIPNSLGVMAVLNTSYTYQGGDLVMQFAHTGSDSVENAFLDSATTASPGYGTSFRAISANTFNATTGAASSLTIVGIVFTPTITEMIASGGSQVIISGSGGIAGATYRILASTDVQLPAAQWTPIITNQFTANGTFGYTNLPNTPVQFFRILLP